MAKWLKLYPVYALSAYNDSCHYTTLLTTDVLFFYLTLDLLQLQFVVCRFTLANKPLIRLLRFGVRVNRAYCHDNFLVQRPLPDMCRLSGVDFLCFNRMSPLRISTRHCRFPGAREREMRETRRRLGACVRERVRVRGIFRARILTILS